MEKSVQRKFIIGDEWLYFKIYSGPKTLESILLKEIYLLVNELMQEQAIDKFFFIRYADPDYHLRIRFHLAQTINFAKVIQRFNQVIKPYMENRLVWKVSADTYNRELERYGSHSIAEIETLFFIDSLAIMNYLKEFEDSDNNSLRWLWGVKCIDTLFMIFGLKLADKCEFCEKSSNGFFNEFHISKQMKQQLKDKYRKEISVLEKTLNGTNKDYNFPGIKHIEWYSQQAVLVTQNIQEEFKTNRSEILLSNLLNNLVHMHFNRLFRTKQRMHEFVIYNFLDKFYKSQMARQKYNPVTLNLNV